MCIYIKTTKEMFDSLEEVKEGIIVGCDALGRLFRLNVTRIPV